MVVLSTVVFFVRLLKGVVSRVSAAREPWTPEQCGQRDAAYAVALLDALDGNRDALEDSMATGVGRRWQCVLDLLGLCGTLSASRSTPDLSL